MGLQTQYKAETSLTTSGHTQRQNKMLAAALRGYYGGLSDMVKEAIEHRRITPEALEATIAPLLDKLSVDELRLLAIVIGVHDLGRVDARWAKNAGMDLAGSDFIAHDYEGEALLLSNPKILASFSLTDNEALMVRKLCKLHSLAGQIITGEGHLAALEELRTLPKARSALHLFQLHSILDSISSADENLDPNLLRAHQNLHTLCDSVFDGKMSLVEAFERQAVLRTNEEIRSVGASFGLGTVSVYRLQELVGLYDSLDPPTVLHRALETTDQSFIDSFHHHTQGSHTWYGDQIARAFGVGFVEQLSNNFGLDREEAVLESLQASIKMIAVGGTYHSYFVDRREQKAFALSARRPAFALSGDEQAGKAVWRAVRDLASLDQALAMMSSGESLLTLRGNHQATEIGWQGPNSQTFTEEVAPTHCIDGIGRTLVGENDDLRFYHLINHLLEVDWNPDNVHLPTNIERDIAVAVFRNLGRRFEHYGIHAMPQTAQRGNSQGPPTGDDLLQQQRARLKVDQRQALQTLFEGSKRYALDTGIALNLSCDNLVWVKNQNSHWSERAPGHWALLSTLPLLKKGLAKYSNTTACPDFERFLEEWIG